MMRTLYRNGYISVAGPGIEPGPQGYEPCEIPLLYPAMLAV